MIYTKHKVTQFKNSQLVGLVKTEKTHQIGSKGSGATVIYTYIYKYQNPIGSNSIPNITKILYQMQSEKPIRLEQKELILQLLYTYIYKYQNQIGSNSLPNIPNIIPNADRDPYQIGTKRMDLAHHL